MISSIFSHPIVCSGKHRCVNLMCVGCQKIICIPFHFEVSYFHALLFVAASTAASMKCVWYTPASTLQSVCLFFFFHKKGVEKFSRYSTPRYYL